MNAHILIRHSFYGNGAYTGTCTPEAPCNVRLITSGLKKYMVLCNSLKGIIVDVVTFYSREEVYRMFIEGSLVSALCNRTAATQSFPA